MDQETHAARTPTWADLALHEKSAGLLTAGLVIAWCMPHTIAGRLWGFSLLAAFTVLLWGRCTERCQAPDVVVRAPLRWIGLLAAALTLWLFGQPWLIGGGAGRSELGSQWLFPLLFAICGYVIGWRAVGPRQASRRASVLRAVVLALAGVTAINVANALWFWYEVSAARLPQNPWLYDSPYQYKVFSSQIALYLFVLAACDLFCRVLNGDSVLGFRVRPTVMLASIGVLGVLTSLSRNALIIWTLSCGWFPILAATRVMRGQPSRRRVKIALGAAFAVMVVCIVGVSLDGRWRSTWEGLSRAWTNFDGDVTWVRNLDRSATLAAQGIERGDESAYERLTYIMLGVRLMVANPLGVGFRRTAYVDALVQAFGPADYLNAHSGIVEFGVGAGVPGLFLFTLLSGLIFLVALRAWSRNPSWQAAALAMMLAAYMLRGILDNTMRNQFAEMAFFLIGLLLGAIRAVTSEHQDRRDVPA